MKIRPPDLGGRGLVDLTPLIDVVFLLLVFFMVTAQFKDDERDLEVVLPKAENGNPIADPPELLEVAVRRDGSFHVGDRRLDREDLGRLLERARERNDDQRVVVRADRGVAVEHPVVVLDICAGLKIPTSIATIGASSGDEK